MTFVLGDITLTLCVSDSDGSMPRGALADLFSFLVYGSCLFFTINVWVRGSGYFQTLDTVIGKKTGSVLVT